MVINNELIISKKAKAVLIAELERLGFDKFDKGKGKKDDGWMDVV